MATEGQLAKFKVDGYVVLDNFLNEDEIESLKSECWRLVEEMKLEEHKSVFETGTKQTSDDYFMNSADKIRFFYEAGVLDEKGHLKVDKHRSLNKIGHGERLLMKSEFYIFVHSVDDGVKDVAKSLGLVDPVVAQSMYIFKQPGIGGEVVPHQDASYLYTQPVNLYGYWIPLEDVTLENGCLWFIPGSHKDGLANDRRFVRNPNYPQDGKQMIYTNPMPDIDQSRYVPVEVKKGSLVLIHGLVVHKSEQNKSSKSRHVYTFHVYDSHQTQYSQENWILPTAAGTFAKLYQTSSSDP